MRSLVLACVSLCLIAYVRQRQMPAAMSLWQQVADNHPSRRDLALRHVGRIERWRTLLGWLLLIQAAVGVVALRALWG